MATGRTNKKWTEIYLNGYSIYLDTRTFGPLVTEFASDEEPCIADGVRGGLPGQAHITPTALQGIIRGGLGTDAYLHYYRSGVSGAIAHVMAMIGIRASVAAGDPCFTGYFYQDGYPAEFSDPSGAVTVNIPFGDWASTEITSIPKSWGILLRSGNAGAITAANSSTGYDDHGAATTKGGYMSFSATGNGTATIKVQHASSNLDGSFADLTGATTGVITLSSDPPTCDIIPTTSGETVNQYLRWQVVLGTATALSMNLAFVRNTH